VAGIAGAGGVAEVVFARSARSSAKQLHLSGQECDLTPRNNHLLCSPHADQSPLHIHARLEQTRRSESIHLGLERNSAELRVDERFSQVSHMTFLV
jgi:hypothetical protein